MKACRSTLIAAAFTCLLAGLMSMTITRPHRLTWFAAVMLAGLLTANTGIAHAQSPSKPQPPNSERTPPRPLRLTTADGVLLSATYFPSERGKEAVPVVVIHELQGQASPYLGLVQSLWQAGCAVIVPDLRGHGASKRRLVAGQPEDLDVSRMGRADIQAMINVDLETVKKFLVQENDEQRLNLNALVVIGIGEGAVIGAHWAARDLNFPSVGALKQGQDVKSLALIAPSKSVKGLTLDDALGDPLLMQLPSLFVVGESSSHYVEAERSFRRLDTFRRRTAGRLLPAIEIAPYASSLDGNRFVNDVPGVIDKVTDFVDRNVIQQISQVEWVSRRL